VPKEAALPNETKVESGTSKNKNGTFIKLSNSGAFSQKQAGSFRRGELIGTRWLMVVRMLWDAV
jgi:hypothetical protein